MNDETLRFQAKRDQLTQLQDSCHQRDNISLSDTDIPEIFMFCIYIFNIMTFFILSNKTRINTYILINQWYIIMQSTEKIRPIAQFFFFLFILFPPLFHLKQNILKTEFRTMSLTESYQNSQLSVQSIWFVYLLS